MTADEFVKALPADLTVEDVAAISAKWKPLLDVAQKRAKLAISRAYLMAGVAAAQEAYVTAQRDARPQVAAIDAEDAELAKQLGQ